MSHHINTRIEAFQRKYQQSYWSFSRAIKAGIQEFRRRQAVIAGFMVESLLAFDMPLIQEACIWVRVWYKAAMDHHLPLSRVALTKMTAEREELYWHVLPPGEPIPVGCLTYLVDDDILEDEEIAW